MIEKKCLDSIDPRNFIFKKNLGSKKSYGANFTFLAVSDFLQVKHRLRQVSTFEVSKCKNYSRADVDIRERTGFSSADV